MNAWCAPTAVSSPTRTPRWSSARCGSWEDRILLCRRAIEPRSGFWTLPAGYLELNETTEAGAAREAWEEARAKIEIDTLLAVYNIPRISQIQLIYRARLTTDDVAAGPESEEVGLYAWGDIPWDDLCLPVGAMGAGALRRHAFARGLCTADEPAGRTRKLLA